MRNFLEALDTAGGHMVVCLTVILVGAGFAKVGVPKAEDLIVGGAAGLFAAMRGVAKRDGQ